ncbi:cytochrome c [Acidimicrobiales bacterium]|nr:cytochrome c [Acidimicrobiales bacterium]
MDTPVIAASTQRQIGYVIAGIVLLAMAVYWLFNWLEGRHETGAEIELAANRKEAMSDEEMETKRLDLSLTGGLVTLTIIALALPLYWLGEPGRQEGLVDFTDTQSVAQGSNLYEANCAQCHGSVNGDGGLAADFSLVDTSGVFVEQVDWVAPSLGAVLDRFTYSEVKYILNYGRSNSPMPAWGGPGGGAMTDQQIDKVIAYISSEQKSSEEIAKGVETGLSGAALFKARQDNAAAYGEALALADQIHDLEDGLAELEPGSDGATNMANQIAVLTAIKKDLEGDLQATADEILAASETDQVLLGELLFNNPAAGGAYGCARCHSAGYSYNANAYPDNPLIDPIVNGGGGFAPSLVGVRDQFETSIEMVNFITTGSENGIAYGAFGQGDGGGQMPGFGGCWAESDAVGVVPRIQLDRITGHCDGSNVISLEAHDGEVIPRDGILSQAQIEAIVAYERSLDS